MENKTPPIGELCENEFKRKKINLIFSKCVIVFAVKIMFD